MSRIDFGTNIKNPVTVPATVEVFRQMVDDANVGRICAELTDLYEQCNRGLLKREEYYALKTELKLHLPFYTPHAHFGGGYKAGDKNPIDSGKALLDIDNYCAGVQLYEKYLKGNERTLGVNAAYTTASGNGFAILFDIPEGLTRQQAQAWMAHEMGDVNYDKGVHDLTRAAYIPSRDHFCYLDEEMMFGDELHPAKLSNDELSHWQQAGTVTPTQEAKTLLVQSLAAVEATSRTLYAFDGTLKMVGLTLEQLNSVGLRHNTLKLLLPTLCQMMSEAELLGVLQQRMPDYAREADCRQLVHDFYAKYVDSVRPMNQKQRELFVRSLNVQPEDDDDEEDRQTAKQLPFITRREMPPALQASLRPYPDTFIMPILVGVMPALMALADGVTCRYCDGKIHHLGGMAVIVAEQSSNKSSIKDVVDMWIEQLRAEDDIVRKKEDRTREKNKVRKQSERGEEAPSDVVRTVPVTISCSKLLKRLKQAQGHCLYSICEEIDTFSKTNGAGSWSAKYDIYRVAFDHSRWGTDYNSDQSESGEVEVAYNWTIMGTPSSVAKCFNGDNVENGLSSRVMISSMPDNLFAPITFFKELSEADRERIRQAVARLREAQGFIDTPRLRKAIGQWLEEKRKEAALAADRVKDIYRRRAAVIGFRCGVVYMLLKGGETNSCLNFACKMAEYTLQQQQAFFGPLLMKKIMNDSEGKVETTVNGNIYADLPNPFTKADLRRLKGNEFADGTLDCIISRWKRDGWVEKTGKKSWTKLLKL
ncbi:MAG: DUF3987 domain-containing protein [Prevotella sp.]|nr:DUF3987 domain-containing protein [Prevotella sp.]